MNQNSKTRLVFVYNADSGLFNTVTDIAHKILSPKTYSCQLCALTHGYFKVRDSWVRFLQSLDVECEFLHRDELINQYQVQNAELPVVYLKKDDHLEKWISRQQLEQFDRVDDLIDFIRSKLTGEG